MDSITFTLDDTRVNLRLGGIAKGVKSFKKPLGAAGKELLEFFGGEVFKTQGAAIGESWRALAASTLRARAKRSGYYAQTPIATGQTLIWTGRLQRGFEKKVSAKELRIFNDVPYFPYHQSSFGRTPQRRMLALTKGVIIKVARHFQAYIDEIVNGKL